MLRIPLIALGFVALGLIGLELSYRETQASPVWLAAGLSMAAILRYGYRAWPAIWLGEFIVAWFGPGLIDGLDGRTVQRTHLGPFHTAIIAFGSSFGAIAGAWILRRCGADAWSSTRDLAALFLAAAVYGGISGAIGAGVLASGGAPFLPVFTTWSIGDLLGTVVATPALLLLRRTDLRPGLLAETIAIAALLALTIGVTTLVPTDLLRSTISYLPLAPLAWAALRLPAGVSSTLLAVWAAAMVGVTVAGKGPFTSPGSSLEQILGFQGYLLAGAAVVHLISLSQRRQELDREELKRSEEQFRLVTQHSHDLICLHDPDGTFRWVSPSVVQILGWRPADLIGRSPYDFIPPEDARRIRDGSHAQVLAGGQGELVAYRFRRADGSWAWLESTTEPVAGPDGLPVKLQTVSRDITQRQQEQQALAEARHQLAVNEERLRLALENSGTGLWDWSLTSDQAYFSPTWMTMLGYRPDELPASGATWRRLVHPDDLPKATAILSEHLTGQTPAYRVEFRLRRKDGSWAWMLACGQAVGGRPGEAATRMIGTHVDITALKRAEVELAAEARRAEEAAKAKSEFLATMSHEIRTPMNGVIGMVSVLEGTPLSAEQRGMVATIRSSGEVLLTVLNDILDLSKIEAGRLDLELQPVAVQRAVDDVANLFRGQAAAKGLTLAVVCDGGPWAHADPHRLRQVLINLLSNAVKFTASGGIDIHAAVADGRCRIAVRDTGIGIPPELMHRLFQVFSQVDASTTRRFGGTGLGLAISRRLVDAMDGAIRVESAPDHGSIFTIELPCCATPPQPVAAGAGAVIPTAIRRVLLAEDQLVNQRVATLLLQRMGIAVTVVADGAQAVEAWRSGAYDLLLLDVQMPVMDGLEAARAIRRDEQATGRPRIPIAALTANALPADRIACREAGMDGLLPKPITRESVAGLLASLAPPAH